MRERRDWGNPRRMGLILALALALAVIGATLVFFASSNRAPDERRVAAQATATSTPVVAAVILATATPAATPARQPTPAAPPTAPPAAPPTAPPTAAPKVVTATPPPAAVAGAPPVAAAPATAGPPASPPPAASPAGSPPAAGAAGQGNVGVEAGQEAVLKCPNGVVLTIRRQTLTREVAIGCQTVDPGSVPQTPGPMVGEILFELLADGGGANDLPGEVNLGIDYGDEDLGGLDESRFVIARLENRQWTPVPRQAPDPVNNFISATINRVGIYTVYRRP